MLGCTYPFPGAPSAKGCCGRNGGELMPELVPAMPGISGVLELLPPGPMGLPKTWRVQWETVGQAGAMASRSRGFLGQG